MQQMQNRSDALNLHFPQPTTPFVGRQYELEEIASLLADPHCRLLTLIGPGGTGKTRLALAAAHALAIDFPHSFAHGAAFVDLQPLADPALLPTAVCDALDLAPSPQQTPDAQLFRHLREREMLLVFDNFERVLDDAAWLSTLLAAASGVRLLVTSREPLRLHEEWQFPVGGLRFPDAPGMPDTHGQAKFSALQLFNHQAQRVFPAFDFNTEAAEVVHICRLVEGMPLAIELAASWRRTLACADIADEIQRNLNFLETQLRNLPARHRSIRAICEQSWARLDPPTQQIFARLSVFHGGFSREAALSVAGAALPTLVELADGSLLVVEGNEGLSPRFRLHELLRQFALEKFEKTLDSRAVAASATEEATNASSVRGDHSAFYLAFLCQRAALANTAQPDALAAIARDIENVRAAWLWAIERGDWAAVEQALAALHRFYWLRSRSQAGRDLFSRALAALPDEPDLDSLRGRLLARLSTFDSFLGDSQAAETHLAEALRLARFASHSEDEAFALDALGTIAVWRGDYVRGEGLLQQSLAAHRQRHSPADEADALISLARLHALSGSYAQARTLADDSLRILRRLPAIDPSASAAATSLAAPSAAVIPVAPNTIDTQAHALDVLGWATFCLGEYDRAKVCYRESLSLFEESGHELGRVLALGGVGSVAWARGGEHLREAEALMAQSVAICREIGQRQHLATHLWWSAQVALDLGRWEQAQALGQEGLAIAESLDNPILCAFNASALGAARCATGDWRASWQWLCQAAEAALQATTTPPLALTAFYMAEVLATSPARAAQASALAQVIVDHPATWHAVRARARSLQDDLSAPGSLPASATARSLDETVRALIDETFDFEGWTDTTAPLTHESATSSAAANRALIEPLTERELEVLALVAEGCTNKEIAEQLIVTVGTVKWYTNAIYGKLAAKNRTQAVAHARHVGLLAV